MNDTAQQSQNIQGQQPQNQVIQPVASGVNTTLPTTQQVTQQPISVGVGKETAPVVTTKPVEYVSETIPAVEMPQEVKEAGVEEVKGETLAVPQNMQQAGVQPVGIAAPVPQEPTLKLPLTEEKAQGILKMHKNVKDSVTWLAMLVVRQMQVLRGKQKEEKK